MQRMNCAKNFVLRNNFSLKIVAIISRADDFVSCRPLVPLILLMHAWGRVQQNFLPHGNEILD